MLFCLICPLWYIFLVLYYTVSLLCFQLNTEWTQIEVIDLINDGTGLGFGIIGGRSTGVVVKTILPAGVADVVSQILPHPVFSTTEKCYNSLSKMSVFAPDQGVSVISLLVGTQIPCWIIMNIQSTQARYRQGKNNLWKIGTQFITAQTLICL